MQIVLNEDDLQRMDPMLREELKSFVFGGAYQDIAKNLEGPSQQAYERTLPIQLDEFALTTLWRGINASSKKILEMFAENDGAVHVIEFMDALHLETPRQLTGPLGGITRKLRKIFGANVNVALWTYDKNEHVYLLLDGHLPILRDFLGMSWAFYEKQRNCV